MSDKLIGLTFDRPRPHAVTVYSLGLSELRLNYVYGQRSSAQKLVNLQIKWQNIN